VPETKYARNGDVSLAYQVFGEGPMLVAIPPTAQNIEVTWEESRFRRMLSSFGSFSRYVHFDRRGASMDEPVDDLRAVLDAAVDTAVLLGVSPAEASAGRRSRFRRKRARVRSSECRFEPGLSEVSVRLEGPGPGSYLSRSWSAVMSCRRLRSRSWLAHTAADSSRERTRT
jgi:hypothetical protein